MPSCKWCPHEQTKYVVGYRPKETIASGTHSSDKSKDSLGPVHETFFYDTMCLHCFLPVRGSLASPEVWGYNTCRCNLGVEYYAERHIKNKVSPWGANHKSRHYGCSCCGAITLKFTIIQAFDPIASKSSTTGNGNRKELALVLASKVKLEPTVTATGIRQQRLIFADTEASQQAINLVRNQPILPLPPRPKASLQSLPSPILDRIVSYVLAGTKFSHDKYIPLVKTMILGGRGSWGPFDRRAPICIRCRSKGQSWDGTSPIDHASECYFECWRYFGDGMVTLDPT
ncbi:hypothetical protein TWF730_007362 [Orbilia blumenaviensis]|uniref:Uncharacterized protein n=1 Tax=Orbilia blumenaviensis TaxID=1796055 RepID=A0AAV9VAH2_9PEZI